MRQDHGDPYVTIGDLAEKAFVVAFKENIDLLLASLKSEGLRVTVLREPLDPSGEVYSPTLDVLRTHMNAWQRCLASQKPAIVVEADFVPVVGLRNFHVPFNRSAVDSSFGYLYACGPELWDLDDHSFARGHAGGAVGYLISPPVASLLLDFGRETLRSSTPDVYSPWDSKMGYFLKEKGVESYIPYRMLGEHGGKANPEHVLQGLSRTNRADCLQGPLHFLPPYADGSKLKYLAARLHARMHGVGRLVFFRYLHKHDFNRAKRKRKLLRFAVGRHVMTRCPW